MSTHHFAIGDIHGEAVTLNELLKHWNPENEQLVFLGDYIDKGRQSKETLERVRALEQSDNAIVLMGNHEAAFLAWLDEPTHDSYTHLPTILSLLSNERVGHLTPQTIAATIKEKYPELIAYMRGMQDYHETKDTIFVHAGVDLTLSNWHDSRPADFKWIRNPFIHGENKTGKRIVFGHTPTCMIHGNRSDAVWVSPDQSKIGIDGRCGSGGYLHGCHLEPERGHAISIDVMGDSWQHLLYY